MPSTSQCAYNLGGTGEICIRPLMDMGRKPQPATTTTTTTTTGSSTFSILLPQICQFVHIRPTVVPINLIFIRLTSLEKRFHWTIEEINSFGRVIHSTWNRDLEIEAFGRRTCAVFGFPALSFVISPLLTELVYVQSNPIILSRGTHHAVGIVLQ